MTEWDTKYSRILRVIAMISAIIACIVMGVVIILFIYHVGFDFWADLVKEHFAATLGLTGAAIVSFAIVVFLRQTEGPIELEGLGMKFKGAAGQVVLWAFCIIVFALCARLLW
jgi:hypothetical protein